MANNAAVDSDNVTPTPAAISAALNSNLALQSELRSRLVDVRKMQNRNRHDATAVLSSLSLVWDSDSDTSTAITSVEKGAEIPLEFWTKKFAASNYSKDNTNHEHECIGSNSESNNEDRHCSNLIWKEEEVKQLQNSVNEARKDTSKQTSDMNEILDEVASKCKIPSRSTRECHAALFTFADPAIVTSKFTKKETRTILEIISELGDGKDVDWLEIATKLNEKLYPSRQHRRTPWQCFKHYQSTLKKTALPWSSDEDELFIKYLAAHGPQFLLQGDGLAQTNGKLFPYRNPNKVSIRTYTTLLNPNYVHDWWTKDEERKLALLMRAYSESDGTLPLKYASQAAHFPRRAQALVSVKWSRSICPEMQQKKCGDKLRHDETEKGGAC
mmetsp:Transcript_10498/g.15862  ORF Transcript_10498/g.15862 Transcript_10498/m.15862 type:complete len:385 (+) Transcript_10498:93-1247(+)